jgi:type IV secretory pathway VirB10-like protein
MSLINDALKKAQKQRTGEAPPFASMPTIGGERASQLAERSAPGGGNARFMQIGLGAAGLVVVVVGVYFIARSLNSPAPHVAAAPAAPIAQITVSSPTGSTPTVLPAAPAAKPAATETASTAFVLPVATPPPVAPPPVVVAKAEPKPVVSEPVETPAPAPAKAAAPKLDSKSVNYIEGLHVAGIRASGSDSKVLMNDRVYRIGDIVEHDLDLKLVGITASSLTFENDSGARYTRNF